MQLYAPRSLKEPVFNIGCDHGKLTAVLAASGRYPKVIGADLRPGPLAKAEQTLEYAGCKDRAELRLGDGLSVLSPGEVSTIVLAGVSAQTTWEIIEKAPWVSAPGGPRLVMVPATRHSDLRRWLWEHGFALAADRPVQAAGRWYAVMAAEYTGEVKTPTFQECLFGLTGQWPEEDLTLMQSFLSQKFRPYNRSRRFFPYSLQNISDSCSAALKLRSLQIFYLPVFYCYENNHRPIGR